jgi:3-hydroxybutyryl-CoA dehydrogenase
MDVKPFDRIACVGAGFMGAQIAWQSAVHGYRVAVVDTQAESLERARESQAKQLAARVEDGRITAEERDAILGRIAYTTDLSQGVAGAGLVIEAVPERLELKRQVFAQLDAACAPETILATTSSSIRISLIEDATGRPDRVLNLHFYPPVWQRSIVDVMRGTTTSDATVEASRRCLRSIGQTPLMVLKESTGFVFNRVWRAIKRECLHLVGDGVASLEDVDRAWMITQGQKTGPFGYMDMVGLDVVLDIERVYHAESGLESDAPPQYLIDMVERGELGIKTGKGFYSYPDPAYGRPG